VDSLDGFDAEWRVANAMGLNRFYKPTKAMTQTLTGR